MNMCDYERSAGCGKQSLRYQCNEMKDCKHKIYIIQQQDIALPINDILECKQCTDKEKLDSIRLLLTGACAPEIKAKRNIK